MNANLLYQIQMLITERERLVQDVYFYQMCENLRPEETAKDFFAGNGLKNGRRSERLTRRSQI